MNQIPTLQILGFLLNLPLTERKVSGTRGFLRYVLSERGVLQDIVDADIYGMERRLLILRSFSLPMSRWRLNFHFDVKTRQARSRQAARQVELMEKLPDATLQIGSEFVLHNIPRLADVPRFSYHDNNIYGFLQSSWKLHLSQNSVRRAIAFEAEAYENMTGILTMTRHLRDIFIEKFGLPEEKVHHIGFGSNIKPVENLQKEYDQRTILFVARHLFEQKGGLVLLEAFKKVRATLPGTRLCLVGQDLSWIDQPGVECIGFLDKTTPEGQKRIEELYRQASLFVMPSYNEAAGNVFLEAMANKIPCIGADTCAMPEIVVESGAGHVIPPGDSEALAGVMIDLLRDGDKLRELGENGQRAIKETYNWDRVADRMLEIVRQHV